MSTLITFSDDIKLYVHNILIIIIIIITLVAAYIKWLCWQWRLESFIQHVAALAGDIHQLLMCQAQPEGTLTIAGPASMLVSMVCFPEFSHNSSM